MSGGDVIAGMGVGGALAISMASLAVSIYVARRDSPHLAVTSAFALAGTGEHWLPHVCIANNGRYPKVVSGVGFRSSDRRQILLIGVESFPGGGPPLRRLEAGESMMAVIPAMELHNRWAAEKLGEMAEIFVNTQSGRTYTAKPLAHFAEHALRGYYTNKGEKVRMD